MAAIEYDEQKVRDVLGLPGYGQFYKGNHITTMSYDFWTSKPGNANDGKRFTLQEIYLSPLAHMLYDDGRTPSGRALLSTACRRSRRSPPSTTTSRSSRWSRTRTTAGCHYFGSHVCPNAGPVGAGTFKYELSEQSVPRARGRGRGDPRRRPALGPRPAS